VTATEADWRHLAGAVTGPVFAPGQPGPGTPFNRRFAGTVPAGGVAVADVDDIRRTLAWARDTGTGVSIRGGGHSFAGYSTGTGLVLDVGALNAVTADGGTGLVTASGGALMSDVYTALQPHEMAFALGNGDSVGIAGLTLGGGNGATSRKFGLTADALVATTLVTAGGEVLHCDARENADLFWACRGGGGGNFGITTSLTFRARPVQDCSTYLLLWDVVDAPKVFSVLQEIVRTAPDEFAARIGVATTGNGTVVSAVGQHLGPAAELREILDPVLAVARPIRYDVDDRTFWEAKDFLRHETAAGAFATRTAFTREPLPDDAVATLLSWLERWPGSGNADGGGAALFSWGGEVNRVAAADTAFPHRDARFLLSMDTSWDEHDEPGVVRANLGWLTGLQEALAPYTSGGAYLNFTDPDREDWRTAYYGANYPRLLEIKRRLDPDGVFAFEQGIGRDDR
jgi:FAD/FMN-containing dehydrogenase